MSANNSTCHHWWQQLRDWWYGCFRSWDLMPDKSTMPLSIMRSYYGDIRGEQMLADFRGVVAMQVCKMTDAMIDDIRWAALEIIGKREDSRTPEEDESVIELHIAVTGYCEIGYGSRKQVVHIRHLPLSIAIAADDVELDWPPAFIEPHTGKLWYDRLQNVDDAENLRDSQDALAEPANNSHMHLKGRIYRQGWHWPKLTSLVGCRVDLYYRPEREIQYLIIYLPNRINPLVVQLGLSETDPLAATL